MISFFYSSINERYHLLTSLFIGIAVAILSLRKQKLNIKKIKMKKLLLTAAAILLVSSVFISCKKEKQEETDSPEQPTTLNQGNGIMETVQRGPNGTNVVFSNWIQKTDPDWMTWGGGTKWTTDLLTTSLTDAVRDKGIVLVYFNFNGFISQLPHESFGENLTLDSYFETGKITVRYTYGGGAIYVNNILNIKLRYVLIPSSSFGNGRMTNPVDYSDYNAVCEYYGIAK